MSLHQRRGVKNVPSLNNTALNFPKNGSQRVMNVNNLKLQASNLNSAINSKRNSALE